MCVYCDLRKLHLTRKQRKVRVRAETKKTRHLRHHQQHQAIKVPSATSVTSEGISPRTAPIKLSGDRRLVSMGIVRLTCMACSVFQSSQVKCLSRQSGRMKAMRVVRLSLVSIIQVQLASSIAFFLLQGPENGSNNDAFWWDGDQLVLSCGHGQVVYLPATSGLCE